MSETDPSSRDRDPGERSARSLHLPRRGAGNRPRAIPGLLAWVAVGLVGVVGVVGCSASPIRQSVPIPPGTPPPAGAPVPAVDLSAPGRTSLQLRDWASGLADGTGIPVVALEAYGNAAETLRQTRPECGLAWTTLAGIGWVETKHGTHRAAELGEDGRALPPIIGVPLDGGAGVADVPDTDGGRLDGDTEHDRAVGPFQFIPESWQRLGVDASGDGVADPNQIDDAAVTAGRLLCIRGGDLHTEEGWRKAVLAYNASGAYVKRVRDAAAAYSVGTTPP